METTTGWWMGDILKENLSFSDKCVYLLTTLQVCDVMWCSSMKIKQEQKEKRKTNIDNKAYVTSPGPLAGGFDVQSLDTRAVFTFRHYSRSPCCVIRTQASCGRKYSRGSYSVLKGQYNQNWNVIYLLLPSVLMEFHRGIKFRLMPIQWKIIGVVYSHVNNK